MSGQQYQQPPPPQYQPPPPPQYQAPPPQYPPQYGPRYEHADIINRFVALIIDGILIGIIASILAWFIVPILGFGLWAWGGLFYFLFWVPLIWLYYGVMEGMEGNATIGKRVMSLKVVDMNYQPIDMSKALTRNLIKALWCFWGILFIIDVILLLIGDQGQQTLGDKIANTYVVTDRTRAPQPYYPPQQPQYQQPPSQYQAPPPQQYPPPPQQGQYPPPPGQ